MGKGLSHTEQTPAPSPPQTLVPSSQPKLPTPGSRPLSRAIPPWVPRAGTATWCQGPCGYYRALGKRGPVLRGLKSLSLWNLQELPLDGVTLGCCSLGPGLACCSHTPEGHAGSLTSCCSSFTPQRPRPRPAQSDEGRPPACCPAAQEGLLACPPVPVGEPLSRRDPGVGGRHVAHPPSAPLCSASSAQIPPSLGGAECRQASPGGAITLSLLAVQVNG